MLVLSVELFVIAILYLFSKKMGKNKFCFWSAVVLTVMAAMRSSKVGPDGVVYAQFFEDLKQLSYKGIFLEYDKEPIFYVVTKAIQGLGANLQIWYAMIGALFAFSVMHIIKKYSKNPMVSLLALFSLGYYTFSFTGLRQTVALAIVILSYCFIEREQYVRAMGLVLVASLFHNSALIVLILILMRNQKIKIWQYVLILISAIGVVVIFEQQVHNILSETLESIERFEGYANYHYGLTWAGFVIQCMIFMFALIIYKGKDKQLLLNASFLGVLFQILTVMMAEFFRVSMYFNIFNIVLLGNLYCENRFSENSKGPAKLIIVAGLLFYFVNSHMNYDYIFYWQ